MDDAPKLDWMYAGPAGHVNTDDYLTGRAVDKTFEHFKLGGAEPLNLDLPAPTLPREKSSVPRIQVDVARKVQEDPLLSIRRQEEERKALLREQMLIQQRLTSHNRKPFNPREGSQKRKEQRSSSESSNSSDLDSKLALKLKQLKKSEKTDSLDEKIAKKLQKLKKKQGSKCSSSSSSEDTRARHRGGKRTSRYEEQEREQQKTICYKQTKGEDVKRSNSAQVYERLVPRDDRRRRHEVRDNYKDSRPMRGHQSQRDTMVKNANGGMKLTEDEMEKRRREMMQHAVVRDNERKVKVDKYRKEVEEEAGLLNASRPKEAAFIKKQLAIVTSNTTVEARIKANVFNIQRSGNSMDSNFARR